VSGSYSRAPRFSRPVVGSGAPPTYPLVAAGPGGGWGASGAAEGQVLAAGDGFGDRVDGQFVGALPVRDQILRACGAGTGRETRGNSIDNP
jgi:hypothetical protein